MLIVAGSFTMDPADRDAFIRSRSDAMVTSRGERGCIEYTFSADPLVPGRVVLYERWEEAQDLADHLTAMRATAATAPSPSEPPVKVLSSEIARYEISSFGPVG